MGRKADSFLSHLPFHSGCKCSMGTEGVALSTHLLPHCLRVDECCKVNGEVSEHSLRFAGISNLKTQWAEDARFNGSLGKCGSWWLQGTISVDLVSSRNYGDLSRGLYKHIHGEVGDTVWRWESFYDATWLERKQVGQVPRNGISVHNLEVSNIRNSPIYTDRRQNKLNAMLEHVRKSPLSQEYSRDWGQLTDCTYETSLCAILFFIVIISYTPK